MKKSFVDSKDYRLMYWILIVFILALFFHNNRLRAPCFLREIDVMYVQDEINIIKSNVFKKLNIKNKYTNQYPNNNKPNYWIIEYDDLELNNQGKDFINNIHMLKILAGENDTLLLKITSSGGPLIDFSEIYSLIKDLKNFKNIKVIVSINKICVSAGYLLATLGDEIYTTEFSMIGSIGIFVENINCTDLLKKIGITYINIKSDELKNPLCPFILPSDTQLKHIKNQTDHLFNMFFECIKENRRGKIKNYNKIKSGDTFNGYQALEIGLVDGLLNSSQIAYKYLLTHNLYKIRNNNENKINNFLSSRCILSYVKKMFNL